MLILQELELCSWVKILCVPVCLCEASSEDSVSERPGLLNCNRLCFVRSRPFWDLQAVIPPSGLLIATDWRLYALWACRETSTAFSQSLRWYAGDSLSDLDRRFSSLPSGNPNMWLGFRVCNGKFYRQVKYSTSRQCPISFPFQDLASFPAFWQTCWAETKLSKNGWYCNVAAVKDCPNFLSKYWVKILLQLNADTVWKTCQQYKTVHAIRSLCHVRAFAGQPPLSLMIALYVAFRLVVSSLTSLIVNL